MRFGPAVSSVCVALLSACTGTFEAPTPLSVAPTSWTIPSMPATCAGTRPAGIKLLTNGQLDATLEAVFTTPAQWRAALPLEALADGYTTNAQREVSALYVDVIDAQSASYATSVAASVVQGLGCGASESEEACVARRVASLGRELWRRPLEAEEVADLVAVFRAGRDQASLTDGVTLMLQALVGAPSFLYRRELGAPDGDHLTLTSDEIAEALAYDFTGAPPDAALREAAASGALLDPARREAEAQRLLESAAGQAHLAEFATEWLGLLSLSTATRDASRFPHFTTSLRDAMVEETRLFTQAVFSSPTPTARALWGSTTTYANDEPAAFYGLTERPGPGFHAVDVSGTTRRGLLGHASVLMAHSHTTSTSPVKRGLLVLRRALCQALPPPPPDVTFSTGSPDEPRTTRERYAQHSSDPSCASCHRLIDPPGFGLEGFDPIGQARTEEHGFPVDTTGELIAGGASGTFSGSVELSDLVAHSEEAADCLVRQASTFALGRVAGEDEACVLQQMRHRGLTRGGDVLEALRTLAGSDAYVTRRSAP